MVEFIVLPRTPSWIKGDLLLMKGKGRKTVGDGGKGKRKEERGEKEKRVKGSH